MTDGPGDAAHPPTDRRRPRSVYGVGTEPDPRFSMANERTALAWVRTGLAFIAGGIALTSVSAVADLPEFLDVVAVLSCLVGGCDRGQRAGVLATRPSGRCGRASRCRHRPRCAGWSARVVIAAAVIVGYAIAQL